MLVKYRCECMKPGKEARVAVTDFEPGDNREEWMQVVRTTLAFDHRRRSPNCHTGDFEYVHLPPEVDAEA